MDRFFVRHCRSTDVSNPTRLFAFLEQRSWDEAQICFRRSPNHARTWLRQTSTSGETIWSMLPLHTAVAFGAPLHLIKELVTVYPDALQKTDHEGKIPLHYAAIFSNRDQQDIMSHMLKYYPEGMWTKASCGRTAIEYARNDELQTTESIRMRKRLSGNSTDGAYHESSFNVSADVDIDTDEKENERNAVYTQKSHRDIAIRSNISSQEESERYKRQKTNIPNARATQQKLTTKKMHFPTQAKTDSDFQALNNDKSNGGERNESGLDESSSCILNCNANVEKVDQKGQRTVYLTFDDCNEDTDDDNDSLSESRNTSEDVSNRTSKHDTDATTNDNNSKKRIMKVLQAASSSMKTFKRQRV